MMDPSSVNAPGGRGARPVDPRARNRWVLGGLMLGTLLVVLIGMASSERFADVVHWALGLLAFGWFARWAWRRRTPGALAATIALPVSIFCGVAAFQHVARSLPPGHDPLELVPLRIGCTAIAVVAFPHAWSLVIAAFWAKEIWARPEPARRVTKGAKVITALVLGSVLVSFLAQRLLTHWMPGLAALAGAG